MNDKLLEQLGRLFETHTASLRKEIQESKEELSENISRTKEELMEAIATSQEDTIEALTDLMNSGYEQHEKRITTIEKHLNIPQSQ